MFTTAGYSDILPQNFIGLSARDAKKIGLKLVRNGSLRRYYDAEDGQLLVAYSYNACIYVSVFDDTELFPRDIFNVTQYGTTTARHQRDVQFEVLGQTLAPWYTHLTLRARRAMEIRPTSTVVTDDELVRWADQFVNREHSRASEYDNYGNYTGIRRGA